MSLKAWLQLDLRSLAIFRILLGGLIAIDTLSRLPYLKEFMTDDGVLTRLAFVKTPLLVGDQWISLHLATGTLFGQVALCASLLACAIGLLLGWHTRYAALGCWFLVNSQQIRNPFICDRGDMQLSLLLFWSLFLPLGAIWSLDARAGRRPFGGSQGIAAGGLVLQLAWIYLFAGLLKNGDFWLTRGDGLKFSLLSPTFATSWAQAIGQWSDGLLRILNYLVIVGELFLGGLLLCPVMVPMMRETAVVLLLIFHGGVLLLFKLGLFPWIGVLASLVLLPSEFWERLKISLPEQVPDNPLPGAFNALAGLAVCLSLLSNLSFNPRGFHLERPAWLTGLTESLRLEQHWELFAPLPPINGVFRLTVVSGDGSKTLVFEGPPSLAQPNLQRFPNHRYKMLMLSSLFPEFDVVREGTARALARRYGAPRGKLHYDFVLNPVSDQGRFLAPEVRTIWHQP